MVVCQSQGHIEDRLCLLVSFASAHGDPHELLLKEDEALSVTQIDADAHIVSFKVENAAKVVLPCLTSNESQLSRWWWKQEGSRVVVRDARLIDLNDANCDIERGLVDEAIRWIVTVVDLSTCVIVQVLIEEHSVLLSVVRGRTKIINDVK